jgi:valyl-tRNA synthetase
VTEELWSALGATDLLAGSAYPHVREQLIDEAAEADLGRAIEAIVRVRGFRDSAGAKPGKALAARLRASGYETTIAALSRLARLTITEDGDADAPVVASVPIPGGSVEILSGDGLDLASLDQRREQARERLLQAIARAQAKLSNPGFLAKAPPAVIEAEQAKVARLQHELSTL